MTNTEAKTAMFAYSPVIDTHKGRNLRYRCISEIRYTPAKGIPNTPDIWLVLSDYNGRCTSVVRAADVEIDPDGLMEAHA